jgi:hypothetical protein
MQAREALRSRITQVEIGEQPPDRDRGSRQQGRLDLAEPTEKSIRQPMWDVVAQQEADIFPKQGLGGCRSHCHATVKFIE